MKAPILALAAALAIAAPAVERNRRIHRVYRLLLMPIWPISALGAPVVAHLRVRGADALDARRGAERPGRASRVSESRPRWSR